MPSSSVAGESPLMATVSSVVAIVVAVTFVPLEGRLEALQVPCMAHSKHCGGVGDAFWHLGPGNVVCI